MVASDTTDAVVQALALRTVLPANWCGGLAAAKSSAFVSPPVGGLVCVTGRDVQALAAEVDVVPLLQRLSRQFGRACWFRSDDEQDEFGWASAARGEVVRAYAYRGDDGHVLWQGDVTTTERGLGCFVDDPRDSSDDDVKWWPDRRLVHAVAAAWALDPDRFGDGAAREPAVGAVGRL